MKHLSYFALTLTGYMIEHHPDKIENKELIESRSLAAEQEFERCSHEGMTVEEARHQAEECLFRHLHFSPYNMIRDIVEEEFPFINEDERDIFVMQMLEYCKMLILQYNTEDDAFQGSHEYMKLYYTVTGEIQNYLENNGLQ